MNIKLGILGVILMIILSILSVIVKDITKLKIPSFAWASLFGLLLATPPWVCFATEYVSELFQGGSDAAGW